MIFRVDFGAKAEKFLDRNDVSKDEIFTVIKNCLKKFRGEDINIDIKKLHGKWQEFHSNSLVFVEAVDWRGGAYKH